MIEQVVIYHCIIYFIPHSTEFFNSVVFDPNEKIVLLMLWADENFAARGNLETTIFNYEVLRDSTRNFDRNNMVGKEGFREVYKV